jgi:hypothetical protein
MDEKMTATNTHYRSPIYLAGATSMSAAVDALFRLDGACMTCISSTPPVVATLAPPNGWNDQFVERFAALLGASAITTPPSLARSLFPRRSEWIKVNISKRSDRLDSVVFPRALFDSEMVYAAVNLDRPSVRGERQIVAIGIWSQFARTLERFGARASDERQGLSAEIALGMVARRYLLAARVREIVFAAASPDPIAAELIGRALLRLRANREDDAMVAPWEEPIVQRAAELGLGVRTPDDIDLIATWGGDHRQESTFTEIVTELAGLIGVAEPQMPRADDGAVAGVELSRP